MKKIKIAEWGGKHMIYLPFYLGIETGFFAKQGLDIEIIKAGNDDGIFNQVRDGAAYFGIGDPSLVIGSKVRVVSALLTKPAVWGFTHYSEIKQITDPSELTALRIGVYPQPSTTYCLIKNLIGRNKNIQLVECELENLTAYLASDKIDIAIEVEPMISFAENNNLRVVLDVSQFFPSVLYTGISCLESTIESDPDLVQTILDGTQLGLRLCHDDSREAFNLAKKIFPALPQEILKNSIDRLLAAGVWPQSTIIEIDDWLKLVKIREDLGLIANDNSDYLPYINNSFAIKSVR